MHRRATREGYGILGRLGQGHTDGRLLVLAAAKEPFIDFYTGDWMKDQAVSRCAPATRGVWIDLLCGMHDDSRSGRLIGTADVLARLGRCSAAELVLALNDL